MIHSFTVLVMNVHHASPDWVEENKNFILASFQCQIGYWSPSLCLSRKTLACQNRSLPWRLPISQRWLILCELWPAAPNQGWWERGWGWLSEVAVMHPGSRCTWAAEQGSTRADPFGSSLPSPSVFLHISWKDVGTARKVIPFVHLKEPNAINTGRSYEQWLRQCKDWYCMGKQKKGKSSYCDPVREQHSFWLLICPSGFSLCFVAFTGLNETW